jgi:hypothetical protein
MATKEEIQELAKDFVLEYLERDPEYMDVVEYVSENIDDEDDIDDDLLKEVFTTVVGELDAVSELYSPSEQE